MNVILTSGTRAAEKGAGGIQVYSFGCCFFFCLILPLSLCSCVQPHSPLLLTSSRVFLSTLAAWAAQDQKNASTQLPSLRAVAASWTRHPPPPPPALWASSSFWVLVPALLTVPPPSQPQWPRVAQPSTLWAWGAAAAPLRLPTIPAQSSLPRTTPTPAPRSRLCCHSMVDARSWCAQWITATAPVCPPYQATVATHRTHALDLFPGRRSTPTLCPLRPPWPSPCRACPCVTGSTPHRATGTPNSMGCTASLLPNTTSQVNPLATSGVHFWFLSVSFPLSFTHWLLLSLCCFSNGKFWHIVCFYTAILYHQSCHLPKPHISLSSILSHKNPCQPQCRVVVFFF